MTGQVRNSNCETRFKLLPIALLVLLALSLTENGSSYTAYWFRLSESSGSFVSTRNGTSSMDISEKKPSTSVRNATNLSPQKKSKTNIVPITLPPTASPTEGSTQDIKSLSIVVQLSGEMGNNLGKIAFGKYLQWILRDDYGIHNTHIVLRHQSSNKWGRAKNAIQRCFKVLRSFDFTVGNTQEYLDRIQQQQLWLGERLAPKLKIGASRSNNRAREIRESLDMFAGLVKHSQLPNGIEVAPPPGLPDDANITLPYLFADNFAMFWEVDRYYDEIRELFAYDDDNPQCCNELPDPDESVFHFRNYIGEMVRARGLGFEEVNSNLTATKLFGHLEKGSKVAITTRFKDKVAQRYVEALEGQGMQARLVTGQTGPQDFCFLSKTQQELVGARISSFYFWAAILANNAATKNPRKIWFYSIDSNATAKGHFSDLDYWHTPYHWNYQPELEARIKFVEFHQ